MAEGNPKTSVRATGLPLWKIDGGVVANAPPVGLAENQAQEAHNVLFFDGRCRARPGFQPSTVTPDVGGGYDSTARIVHLGYMVTQDQAYHLMRAQASLAGAVTLYQYTGSGSWVNITGSAALTASPSRPCSSAQFKGEWLFCSGNDNLQRWNGSGSVVDVTTAQSNALLRAPAQPYFVCATGSRVFLANAIDQSSGQRVPYRVWWSTTGDSSIWGNGYGIDGAGSASYEDIIQGRDSSAITGLYFQGATQVIVFKRHSIFRSVYKGGPVWYDFVCITQSRGCVASGSIQCFNDTLVWLGDDYNVYAMGLNGQVMAIGDAVRPLIEACFDPGYQNGAGVSSSLDTVLGLYWLSIPVQDAYTGAVTYTVFTCNLRTGAWSTSGVADTGLQLLSGFWLQPDPPFFLRHPVAIWGASDGRIYALDYDKPALVDNQTPFDARWWGRAYDALAFSRGAGESVEFHKTSIHGSSGYATPRIRFGRSVAALLAGTQTYTYDAMGLADPDCPAYVANVRAAANRFAQIGIYWAPGERDPAIVDGFTSWGLPRQEVR